MRWFILLLLIIIPLGGCQGNTENNQKGNSETVIEGKALEDHFTSKFITSPKEVEEGFYEFKSRTGKYTMLFPRDATMSRMVYNNPNDVTESLEYYIESDLIAGDANRLRLWYTERKKVKPHIRLKSVARHVSYDGDFEKTEDDGRTIHTATTFDDGTKLSDLKVFGSIHSEDGQQNINYLFNVTYEGEGQKEDQEKVEKYVRKLIESIEFSS